MPTLLTSLAAQITSIGISAPAYTDINYTLTQQFLAIYGLDTVNDVSTQDVQWLGVLSRAFYDEGQAAVAAYNAFRPGGAQGVGLSTIVKINGIARLVSSNSTVAANIVGQAGTIITNGIATDATGNRWDLPASITIPVSGSIIETLTCETPGSVALGSGVALTIFTPTPGWQTITTTSEATLGSPVETDAALQMRQTQSTGLSAQTPLEAIVGNVEKLAGVTQVMAYENDTNSTNSIGLPAHSFALVVSGGSATAIAMTIAEKKTIGALSYGTTTETVIDPTGVPLTISFYITTGIQVYALVTINPLTGYVSTTGTAIINALQTYINTLLIGGNLIQTKLYGPANLYGDAATSSSGLTQAQLDLLSATYTLTSLYLARSDMTVTSTITAGATALVIGNPGSLVVGSQMLLTNSDASQSLNTVTGISGSTITFTPAIATGKTVSAGSMIYVNGSLTAAFYEDLEMSASTNVTLIT